MYKEKLALQHLDIEYSVRPQRENTRNEEIESSKCEKKTSFVVIHNEPRRKTAQHLKSKIEWKYTFLSISRVHP